MPGLFYCNECGEPYEIDDSGILRHVTADGEIDYDNDADHVPYGEEFCASSSAG